VLVDVLAQLEAEKRAGKRQAAPPFRVGQRNKTPNAQVAKRGKVNPPAHPDESQ